MGNVMDGTYPNRELLKWLYRYLHVDRMAECESCAWRYICGGGCPLWRLTVLENPAVTQGTINYCRGIGCHYTRSIVEALLWERAQESASRLIESLTEGRRTNTAEAALC
jgi:uncharacterized protein